MLDKLIRSVVGLHGLSDPGKLGPIRVVDGDDIEQGGVRYRLDGYDAPEIKNLRSSFNQDLECNRGLKAKLQLERLIRNAKFIHIDDLNKVVFPARRLARLVIDGEDVATIAIANRWGCPYRERKATDWGNPKTPFNDALPIGDDVN